ncbi:rhodanese-like domain-containing protein [Sediminibacillus dalangtanensis]|uniref:Rhodanese-like domain-containing protein n=1 Tax=Sediminibacillus dalangtanensis TaxID=2729421 RepID=A0ABX7VUQ8_9BACI|nr:rhodanese-like domain-containing protein [Sediminibacillus dalangtanensis]QTN00269.1 rhodanese-like domain-containing protein [Sediminibacillus dalangtanensis]
MKEITAKKLQGLIDKNQTLNILDVREAAEVADGKIPGAVNIPLGLLELRMHELVKTAEYMVVCRSGGRSAQAVQFLESRGFQAINITGGMLAWEGEIE